MAEVKEAVLMGDGKYQPYLEYKDSGVEWLGWIPTHWHKLQLKRHCSVSGGFAFPSDSLGDEGTPVIRIGDILTDGSVSLTNCKYVGNGDSIAYSKYRVSAGDLLMAMTGATIGKAGWYKEKETALLNQRVGTFKAGATIDVNFLWYVLASAGYQEHIRLTAFGGAQPNISDTGMLAYETAFPSLLEQRTIAAFLDYETTRIDQLIAKQQRLIELLKEKRQTVISHAVTKGLNPNVPMKVSGVEWLGQVPEHWVATPLKHYAKVIDCKHITAEFTDQGFPLASISEVKGWSVNLVNAKRTSTKFYEELIEGGRKPRPGDIIYSRNATVGEAALVTEDMPDFAMGQDVCLIRLCDSLESEFLLYVLKSGVIETQLSLAMVGSTFKRINVDNIRNFLLALPPKSEQKAIVKTLSNLTSKYDSLVFKAQLKIGLMQERRTALISAAVTGKIDLRGWTPPKEG